MNRTTRVEDLMTTAVISLHEDEPITRAQLEMRLADIHHLPVVDGRARVLGIISSRNLIGLRANDKALRASDVMTRGVKTIHASQPAHVAAGLMLHHRIGALPVVGDDECLVGILTETDFLMVAQQALGGPAIASARAF